MFGYGVPLGKVEYQTFRCLGGKYLFPPEYGIIVDKEEAEKIDIETGRAVPYVRNSIKFLMSRRYRKHLTNKNLVVEWKCKEPTIKRAI